eukprot:CAMPEP_0113308644 /NCGR_PEP_ID=MMETSP0010_2-20120614/7008_1 /TAXON_ID=216773 ORGANISM="Corethron hystrix, Strain 308" /NCGR_SAMPLE_ID=MMETSP0010_2 /ASSEMBLY_ACC=CAM_ASM_000155 /LENGTH=199 /DNA_ID=CAMNT_0000163743 /DNA_START=361 /DNA_END=960 /DNA_ORIENTATION=+ /assembly_acc=CAM_ASM_000155
MFCQILSVSMLLVNALAFMPAGPIQRSFGTSLNLKVGETAPDFKLEDQNGKFVSRSSIKKPLVVYFYPADSTPGCTAQSNAFNAQVKDIRKQYGADLVGISGQNAESKQKFAAELGLDFSILADEGDAVRKAFGVPKAGFGFFPGRVTYVLDKSGECVFVYDNLVDAESHVQKATEALAELKPAAKAGFALPKFELPKF